MPYLRECREGEPLDRLMEEAYLNDSGLYRVEGSYVISEEPMQQPRIGALDSKIKPLYEVRA